MADRLQLHVPIREKLLINGYIREIKQIKFDQIIPYSINMICIDYYHSVKLLYHFADGFESCFHVADIHQNTKYIYNIATLNKTHHKNTNYIIWNSAMYLQKNFKIPHQINENINNIMNDNFTCSKSNEYDIIFRCGGSADDFNGSTYCSAFILSPIIPSLSEQLSFNWELPNYPQPTECHTILYSVKHGLLSIGGYTSGKERLFYRLLFDNFDINNNWKWEQMPSTKDKRSWSSCIFIDDNRILTVGGYDVNIGAINTVEMFDFIENKWNSRYIKHIKYKRYREGILFDKEDKRIFISGGKGALRCTEWYDFTKNKWFHDIPNYQYKIDFYPILYKERKNILYVASEEANCMQWMDLREKKIWNVVYGKNKSLTDQFGIEFKAKYGDHTRLLL